MTVKTLFASLVTMGGLMLLPTPAYASFDDQYMCDALGDADALVVISSENSANASVQISVTHDGGMEGEVSVIDMRQIPAASGMKYAGLGYVFHAKGPEGILETEAGSTTCRFAGEEAPDEMSGSGDEETDAYAESQSLEAPATSWGGIVRAGPGMEFDRVTSLREGDPVTLLVDTGEEMNGYRWFMIRLSDGTEAYQWGGILCTEAPQIDGTFAGEGCP
ncbi:MliC family protein [Pontixanthobacter aestiaquae]|uniref:C-type lysozyme inhibitor domain-containing protein n=1 Tax=Pontixanthobacter aestiaquae TaxID=1509367 RepID=A0A844Z587_9SPHN|nr:MliC family protein [Pontixanthobacter aestiaquae]MDN3646346.1 MliC family protein [Pontixanthobacter aestiaquae]MXO82664.1 hypothetical protein [Pontixanthobacter aestiaquae]